MSKCRAIAANVNIRAQTEHSLALCISAFYVNVGFFDSKVVLRDKGEIICDSGHPKAIFFKKKLL